MSAYQELLGLAEQQAVALQRGDLETAIGLLEARGALLVRAGTPSARDLGAIRQVLRLDRELSSAIRERMIQIREDAAGVLAGRQALDGYGRGAIPPVRVDCVG